MALKWQLLPHIALAAFHLWGPTRGDQLHSHVPTLGLSGELCISFSSFSSPSSVQVPGRTCHWSIQTSYPYGTCGSRHLGIPQFDICKPCLSFNIYEPSDIPCLANLFFFFFVNGYEHFTAIANHFTFGRPI